MTRKEPKYFALVGSLYLPTFCQVVHRSWWGAGPTVYSAQKRLHWQSCLDAHGDVWSVTLYVPKHLGDTPFFRLLTWLHALSAVTFNLSLLLCRHEMHPIKLHDEECTGPYTTVVVSDCLVLIGMLIGHSTTNCDLGPILFAIVMCLCLLRRSACGFNWV